MNCPKCRGLMLVLHTYLSPGATIRRRVCEKCGVVGVTQEVMMVVDPPRGQGAHAIAQQRRKTDAGASPREGPAEKG